MDQALLTVTGLGETRQKSSSRAIIALSILSVVLTASLVGVACLYFFNPQVVIKTVYSEVANSELDYEFAKYVMQQELSFDQEEYSLRKQIFHDNLNFIRKNNNDPNSKVTLGITKFAHLTFEEFAEQIGLNSELPKHEGDEMTEVDGEIRKSVDWVAAGAVTPVKDQGKCGSCWAFSTTGGIEGAKFIADGKLVSYSEQQLMDCTWKEPYLNEGCNGGSKESSFQYVMKHGIYMEKAYPYVGIDKMRCKKIKQPAQRIRGYKHVPAGTTKAFFRVLSNQPVSISVASNRAWQHYVSGVMDYNDCPPKGHNHAVLAVGFEEGEFVNVKNSWGKDWGEKGYIRLAYPTQQKEPGPCNFMMYASFPVI